MASRGIHTAAIALLSLVSPAVGVVNPTDQATADKPEAYVKSGVVVINGRLGEPAPAVVEGVDVVEPGEVADPLANWRDMAERRRLAVALAVPKLAPRPRQPAPTWTYTPTDHTYKPKTEWTYQRRISAYTPKRDWTYTPKRNWTYHPKVYRWWT